MKDSDKPTKTPAGLRELAERRHALHSRQRVLLIAIHGEHTVAELRRQFQALGDVDAILGELAGLGLISASAAIAAVPAQTDEALPALLLSRQFLNESAVVALGLRSFLFTLKLEKCYTKEDLDALLPEYQRVLTKGKGAEFASNMVRQAQALIARI